MALAAVSDLLGAGPSNPSLAACSAALCSSWLAPGRELQIMWLLAALTFKQLERPETPNPYQKQY